MHAINENKILTVLIYDKRLRFGFANRPRFDSCCVKAMCRTVLKCSYVLHVAFAREFSIEVV